MTAALIIFIAGIALLGGTWFLLRWDDRRGDPGDGDREAATFRKIAHEIAHEEYLPAPLAACPAARPPSLEEGFHADLAMNKRDEDKDAGLLPAPTITLAPALQDAGPPGGPSAGARAPETSGTEMTAGVLTAEHELAAPETPGPDGAPEGDGPAARPPQGTTGPGDLLAKAKAAIDALPVDGYLNHVEDTTAYADGAPWNPLSAETIARGMPPIKADA